VGYRQFLLEFQAFGNDRPRAPAQYQTALIRLIRLIISATTNPQTGAKFMAKGQQNKDKMVKKPKKDTAPPKLVSPDAVRPTVVTQVPLRGKLKNK
jgi:hypothetical protein